MSVRPGKRALHADGALVPLTRREFDVMGYLVAREGEPVSCDSLIEDVWGPRIVPAATGWTRSLPPFGASSAAGLVSSRRNAAWLRLPRGTGSRRQATD
jgi:hypothetical protein